MELTFETGRAFGLIEPINPNSTTSRIKVLGLIGDGPQILPEFEIKRLFPPTGYVFAAENVKLHEGNDLSELVQFSYAPASSKKFSYWDDFVVSSKVRRLGSRLLILRNYVNNQRSLDLNDLSLAEDVDKTNFYALAQNRFIIGKLNAKNGQLSSPNKFVKKWDKDGQDVLCYMGVHYLLSENPVGESTTLDCSTDRQLADWFRDKLRMLSSDWVDVLDQKTSWRKDLVTVFSQEEDKDLQLIRFQKAEKLLNNLQIESGELIRILEASTRFREWYEMQIDTHKRMFLESQGIKVSEMEKEYNNRRTELEADINRAKKQLKENQQKLNEVDDLIKRGRRDLEHVSKEKERLFSDFSILDNIMRNSECRKGENFKRGYLIEENYPELQVVLSRQELIDRMKLYLSREGISPQAAGLSVDTFLLHKSIFLMNMRVAKCLINAFGKVKYVIQQVEVDWLHFSDLWNNGLGDIWTSAHNHPNYLHILILQDVNLASPECYSRPLLDMITGFRSRIPFEGTPYPPNLRIIASKASSVSPRIGLPLLRETFIGWGQIGFNMDITLKEEIPILDPIKDGFVDVTRLEDYYPDELERVIIMNSNAQILPELYDQFD